jgi:phosphoglucomutase
MAIATSLLETTLLEARNRGDLLPDSVKNILFYLNLQGLESWEKASLHELLEGGEWTELNDRFYRTLKFGTGGIRGRTIGRVVTRAETGAGGPLGAPQYPAAGTNVMNFFNVSRATQGLCRYLIKRFQGSRPRLVISHDTRHFSRAFAELAAHTASQTGVDAFLFGEERSTPELSFAVRHLKAHAGIMLTASHNPPHDNGFKAYFDDGAQIVEPHAGEIIKEVLAVSSRTVETPATQQGLVCSIGKEVDDAYLKALDTLVLEPKAFASKGSRMKMVFTPIHGTGIKIIPASLERFGVKLEIVAEQAKGDGRFPTVQSPNPENAEALALGIALAGKTGADVVFATDPDADRMGVAVRKPDGGFELLSGNQIGSLLAAYRLERMFASGWLTEANKAHAALIKTFVTTDLQQAIAAHYGVKCVNTLTGFKYIGQKLGDYETAAGGNPGLSPDQWRERLLEKSTFFVFGGEESYGYSGGDYVRDKDANAAVLMFAELAAGLASRGTTVADYLREIYSVHGCFAEKLGTLTFEGAEGAAKISRLLESYRKDTPKTWAGKPVVSFQNFAEEEIRDVDGKQIPKELMLMFHLEGGNRIAIRGSGTEPKIKFYFFGKAQSPSLGQVEETRRKVLESLEELWGFTQDDAHRRAS